MEPKRPNIYLKCPLLWFIASRLKRLRKRATMTNEEHAENIRVTVFQYFDALPEFGGMDAGAIAHKAEEAVLAKIEELKG